MSDNLSAPASPSPLWGGTARSAKGGGFFLGFLPSPTPLPASPARGEVPSSGWDLIQFNPPADTSPLMGEAGRG
ncbi:MAG: hypothetical protein JWP26_3214 [Devosia sp.]|nr:hypothetical protein [Devosia sp.]